MVTVEVNDVPSYAISVRVYSKGYSILGTDYESFNPSGAAFWQKDNSKYLQELKNYLDTSVVIQYDG